MTNFGHTNFCFASHAVLPNMDQSLSFLVKISAPKQVRMLESIAVKFIQNIKQFVILDLHI